MATNKTIIKNMNAQGYNAQFESTIDGYAISGSLSTNGQKQLSNINGSVKQGETVKGSFNAYRMGADQFRYNFSDISDLDTMESLSAAVKAVVAEVEAKLAE